MSRTMEFKKTNVLSRFYKHLSFIVNDKEYKTIDDAYNDNINEYLLKYLKENPEKTITEIKHIAIKDIIHTLSKQRDEFTFLLQNTSIIDIIYQIYESEMKCIHNIKDSDFKYLSMIDYVSGILTVREELIENDDSKFKLHTLTQGDEYEFYDHYYREKPKKIIKISTDKKNKINGIGKISISERFSYPKRKLNFR